MPSCARIIRRATGSSPSLPFGHQNAAPQTDRTYRKTLRRGQKHRWEQMPKLHVAPPEASAMICVDFPLFPVRALGIPPLSAGQTLPSCARPRSECRKACGHSIRAVAHRRSSGCEAALECVSIFSRSRPCDHDSSARETTARETSMPLAFAFARYTVDFCTA